MYVLDYNMYTIMLGLCVHVLAVCTMHRWIVYNLTEK